MKYVLSSQSFNLKEITTSLPSTVKPICAFCSAHKCKHKSIFCDLKGPQPKFRKLLRQFIRICLLFSKAFTLN